MTYNKKYKRILLKISGEALAGEKGYGTDKNILNYISKEIKTIHDLGIEMAMVVGGGNIFRGISKAGQGMNRASADYAGMLATVMNAIMLQDAMESNGIPTRVQTAIDMKQIAEPFLPRKAIRHMEKGRVVIFAAGTGNPFFTTDTAAALRSAEINADLMLKGTKVDGVYSADPIKDNNATKFDKISYKDVLSKELKVMDSTAISLCKDNKIPLIVYNMNQTGDLLKIINGESIGTIVKEI